MPPPPRLRRLIQLFAGLLLYGVSDAMLLLAGLGVDPWDVFHQGLSRRFGLGVGTWAIIVGLAVLLLWIPLRQRPGLGTVCNVIVVGSVIDLVLATVPPVHGLPARLVVMSAGVILNGIATGAYIGAGLGPGPRDGLMTGLAARGHSIRVVRTMIEITVLITGWVARWHRRTRNSRVRAGDRADRSRLHSSPANCAAADGPGGYLIDHWLTCLKTARRAYNRFCWPMIFAHVHDQLLF